MTDDKLTPERVRELLNKSTPGPWTLMEPGPLLIDGDGMTVLTRQNGDMLAAAPGLAIALLAAREERDALRVEVERLNKMRVHCENCGADYIDTGLHAGCPCRLTEERDALRAERDVLLTTAKTARKLADGCRVRHVDRDWPALEHLIRQLETKETK